MKQAQEILVLSKNNQMLLLKDVFSIMQAIFSPFFMKSDMT
jgi:hypothetical protein